MQKDVTHFVLANKQMVQHQHREMQALKVQLSNYDRMACRLCCKKCLDRQFNQLIYLFLVCSTMCGSRFLNLLLLTLMPAISGIRVQIHCFMM